MSSTKHQNPATMFFKALQGTKILLALIMLHPVHGLSQPVIIRHPADITVVKNEPTTLECRVSGSPDPIVEWYKDGQLVHIDPEEPNPMLLPDGSLFFLKAVHNKRQQDDGVYWCVASNSQGVARSANATLQIAFLNDEFRIVPTSTDVVKGEDVMLECSPPRGNPTPVVKWKKDGAYLDLTSAKRIKIDESGNLVIFKADLGDGGRYECCSSNVAATRVSSPVRLTIIEPPSFSLRPKSVSVLAGEDALLECQVEGVPMPDITWSRTDDVIGTNKLKIIPRRGLKIKYVHPSDEGEYVCTAQNAGGRITATAWLKVHAPPVITVPPESHSQVSLGAERVVLSCLVIGTPAPLVYWIKEDGSSDEIYFSANSNTDNGLYSNSGDIKVNGDGSLEIINPQVSHSGHYTCSSTNEVGSAIARANLVVYDFDNPTLNRVVLGNENQFVSPVDTDRKEARLSLNHVEITLVETEVLDPKTVKVTWKVSQESPFIYGYRIWYKAQNKADSSFSFELVSHSYLKTCEIQNLEENTNYHVFVQPFYKDVIGRPSQLMSVSTPMALPSLAPAIQEARLLNASSIFLSWDGIPVNHHNGPLLGYEIIISGNSTYVNNTVQPASIRQVTLFVQGMMANKVYSIQIGAVNELGRGPLSEPLEIELDPRFLYGLSRNTVTPIYDQAANQMTLIIIVIAICSFILILLSGILFYKRKMGKGGDTKHDGYLEAATTCAADEYYHHQIVRSNHGGSKAEGLWIDRKRCDRKDDQADKESSASAYERKLLSQPNHYHTRMNSNSDTEYTYVENNKHNTSHFATSSSGASRHTAESPEPYATTDIIKGSGYAIPMPMMNYSRTKPHQSKSSSNVNGEKSHLRYKKSTTQAGNILDYIPPPPVHPPPSTRYNASQESVISPKYLFSHPIYQSTSISFDQSSKSMAPKSTHRIHPSQRYGNDYQRESEVLTRLLPRETNDSKAFESTSQDCADPDLENELQNFKDVVTNLSRGLGQTRPSPNSCEDVTD